MGELRLLRHVPEQTQHGKDGFAIQHCQDNKLPASAICVAMGGKVLAAAGRGFLITDAASPTAVILTFSESRQGGRSVSNKSITLLWPLLRD
jgi:hypothetical protein